MVFRVTQEEHQLLQDACDRTGARNLSEFTRTELLNHISGNQWDSVRAQLARMEKRLIEVEATHHRKDDPSSHPSLCSDGAAIVQETAE